MGGVDEKRQNRFEGCSEVMRKKEGKERAAEREQRARAKRQAQTGRRVVVGRGVMEGERERLGG